MRFEAVLARFPEIEPVELTLWIERRWVRPDPLDGGGWLFHDIDIARVQLVHELRIDLAIAEEAVPLVLSLIDQLHDARHRLRAVIEALGDQPPAVRSAVANALGEPGSETI